jgi:DNA-binding transcriptional regulator YiaG
MSEETKRALLAAAANRLGVTPLARKLNVPDSLLAAWMSGHASMPDRKLLLLAALLEKPGDNP